MTSRLQVVVKNLSPNHWYWEIQIKNRSITGSIASYSRRRDAIRYAAKFASKIDAVLAIEKE